MLRSFVAPTGHRQSSPGQCPGETVERPQESPERAKQTDGLVLPFHGSSHVFVQVPRALPWADLWLPLQGEFQNRATSKLARRVSMGRVQTER
jgi:hypothetical protein